MGEPPHQIQHPFSLPPPPLPPLLLPSSSTRDGPTSSSREDPPPPTPPPPPSLPLPPPPPPFDPSRMIGIIRRKALIKDLAAAYHAECLAYCQELLERQKKIAEPFPDIRKGPEESRKETRPPKRMKKTR